MSHQQTPWDRHLEAIHDLTAALSKLENGLRVLDEKCQQLAEVSLQHEKQIKHLAAVHANDLEATELTIRNLVVAIDLRTQTLEEHERRLQQLTNPSYE